jgi:hypothetical protein
LLFPLWVQYWNVWDIFLWAKTISLIPIAVIWCSVLHLGINNDCWTQWGTFAVLSTNILEAVIIKDALPKPRRRDMDSTECFHWCSLNLIWTTNLICCSNCWLNARFCLGASLDFWWLW